MLKYNCINSGKKILLEIEKIKVLETLLILINKNNINYKMANVMHALVEWKNCVNKFDIVQLDKVLKADSEKYQVDKEYKVIWDGKQYWAKVKKIGTTFRFKYFLLFFFRN